MSAGRILYLASAVLLCVTGEQTIGVVNSLLDPDRVTWWRGKWAPAPIVLSANNKGATGVTVSVYFTPSTTVGNGILEVTFPTGFTQSSLPSSTTQTYQLSLSLTSGVDTLATIPGIVNPTSIGLYGPFSLRTRFSPGGQTIDVNLNFASVYIVAEPGTLGSLSVALGGSAVNPAINKAGNSLHFKFTISISLWKYDTFVITIDNRWTVANSGYCSSQDYLGRWNNFNGSNAASPHALNCVVSSKTGGAGQTVYIYGLAVDGVELTQTADNQYVGLLVGGVTTPDRVLSPNTYTWTVATTRFATGTVLETGTVIGAPLVSTDLIYSATWKPTWTLAASSLIPGLSLYMDFSFPLANKIPSGGSISITLTEDLISNNWSPASLNCYIVTKLIGASCVTSGGGVVSITSLPDTPAGTFITVRNIVKLTTVAGGAVKATDLKTYDGAIAASNGIDAGSSLPLFTMGNGGGVAADFMVQLLKGDGTTLSLGLNPTGGAGDGTGYLNFAIKPVDTTIVMATSKITIYCPIASSPDDFNLYIPTGLNLVGKIAVAGPVDMTAGTTVISSASVTAGSNGQLGTIDYTLPAALVPIATGSYLYIAHYANLGSSSLISLPKIATNLATAYECRLEITDPAGIKPPHRFLTRLAISPRPFKTYTFSMPCLDGLQGAPGLFKVSPDLMEIKESSTTATFYVEFIFTVSQSVASSNTGLVVGTTKAGAASYPHYSNSATPTSAYIYSSSGTTTNIFITGFPELRPGNDLIIYFPLVNNVPSASLTATFSSSYMLVDDPRYDFVAYRATLSSATTTTAVTASLFPTATASPPSLTTGDPINSSGFGLALKLGTVLAATTPWVYILMPIGTVWTSDKGIRATGGGFDTVVYFSSPSNTFSFPGVLIKTTATSVLTNTADTTYTLSGFTLPIGSGVSVALKVVQGNTEILACHGLGTVNVAISAGKITSVGVSPNSVKARGTEGVDIKHTLTFLLPHGLPSSGSLHLTITSDWKTTSCSVCKATGLKDFSITRPVTCTISNNEVVISSFADFQTGGNASVTVEVGKLLPPGSPGTYNFVQTLGTYTQVTGGLLVDQYTVTSATEVAVVASSGPGSIIYSSKKTFPMNASSQRVDLYLRFSLSHTLPQCGVINIGVPMAWRLGTGDNKNNCYLSPTRYTGCVLTGTTLQVTVAGDTTAGTYLELYLDAAVDNPGSTTASGFQISTTWFDIVLDTDGATVQTIQKFTPGALLSSVITPDLSGISFDPVTSSEPATYIFTFTDSQPYASGDQFWLVFPSDFDPFLGDLRKWFSSEPSTYYIDCSCPSLGLTWCTVDHGTIVVSGKAEIAAGQTVSITVKDVINPPPGTTGSFELYHTNGNGDYLSVIQSFGRVTTVAPSGKVDVRGVSATNTVVQQQSTYVFRFYIVETLSTESQLRITFPKDYDLPRVPSKDVYACNTSYKDQSSSTKLTTLQEWNQSTLCAVSGNTVILPPPKASFTFDTTQQISLTITDVRNPQVGTPRTPAGTTSDFDVWDTGLWPAYSAWTGKFTLFVYKTSSKSVTSRSYPSLNAGYLGLTAKIRTLMVTSDLPGVQTNRISVYSGTQSGDFYISTASAAVPCAAKSLQFTPGTNAKTPDGGRLKYTSKTDSFTIKEGRWRAQFRIAAATGMVKGLYLVDWDVKETAQAGVTENVYGGLPSTVVEVYQSKKGQFQVVVAAIPNILIGYSSVPIKVSLPTAPHTELIATLSIQSSPPKLTLSPSTLTFSPDVSEQYFQIQVALDYSDSTSGSVLSLVVTLSGTDSDAYSPPSLTKFTISPTATQPSAGSVLTWGIGTVTRTKASLAPRVDQSGVVYWHLAAEGTAIPEFAALRTAVGPFGGRNSTAGTGANNTSVNDIMANETWTDYHHRLLQSHLSSEWIGALAVWDPTASLSLTIDWLWAGCRYQITGYLDNLNPYPIGVTAKTETFGTTAIPACQPFSLKFQGQVEEKLGPGIAQLVAKYQGVNPLRLFGQTYAVSYSRRMQGIQTYTTFSYTLVPDRFIESSDPSTQSLITGLSLSSLKSDLNSTLSISSSLYSISNASPPLSTPPAWTIPPTLGNATSSSVSVSLRASVPGLTCCIAARTSSPAPSATQVMSGVGANNALVKQSCVPTNTTAATNTVEIPGLAEKTPYFVYCTAGDQYPLWPTLMSYAAGNPMLPVAMQTIAAGVVGNSTNGGGLVTIGITAVLLMC